jgi:hypothetical protein
VLRSSAAGALRNKILLRLGDPGAALPPARNKSQVRLSYSELFFCDEAWPDFSRESLELALADYSQRVRTRGGRIAL